MAAPTIDEAVSSASEPASTPRLVMAMTSGSWVAANRARGEAARPPEAVLRICANFMVP
jgi:hypothetical protein